MRKTLFCTLALLLLCACGGAQRMTTEEVLAELAEHCDAPVLLGQILENPDDLWAGRGMWAGYALTPGFARCCCLLEGDGLELELGGWPDVLDNWHVTRLRLTGGRYSLFGLRAGDMREEADRVLRAWGYAPAAEDARSRGYTKGEVWLGVRWDGEGRIVRLTVSIPSTNREGVDF